MKATEALTSLNNACNLPEKKVEARTSISKIIKFVKKLFNKFFRTETHCGLKTTKVGPITFYHTTTHESPFEEDPHLYPEESSNLYREEVTKLQNRIPQHSQASSSDALSSSSSDNVSNLSDLIQFLPYIRENQTKKT